MKRRELLHLGAALAIKGLAENSNIGEVGPIESSARQPATPPFAFPSILASSDDHRRRLQNIAECNRRIKKCLFQQLILDYLPGQVAYNLGEYPLKPWKDPDQQDEQQLDELSNAGVELIHLHDEWNDSKRLFGGDKFTPVNERGFRKFIQIAQARKMKVTVYASSGYFERGDPDFRPEWARTANDLVEIYWHLAHCSPASPSWRAYLLPRLLRLMDEYGVDGLYNDLGYDPLYKSRALPGCDEISAFKESENEDGALGDLLSIIYQEVKRRGGIVKVHRGNVQYPHTPAKVYDYLWVGEATKDLDAMREAVKMNPRYVVPCSDLSQGAKLEREDDLYLHSIPYLQFPLLMAGRPFTGERSVVPGFKYAQDGPDGWTAIAQKVWRYFQSHPDGPYTYGWWDSCPGRSEARATYYRWLRLYRPLVQSGTQAYIELVDSDFFVKPSHAKVVASVFAHRDLYLVLANYSRAGVTVETRDPFFACDQLSSPPSTRWPLKARTLVILKR